MQTRTKTRDEREYAQWAAMRKAKSARVKIDRTPLVRPELSGGKRLTVHGKAIVVTPSLHTSDRRKAFGHWCRKNGVSLVAVESTGFVPPTVRKGDEVRADTTYTAFLAYGSVDSLNRLTEHAYVGNTNWTYATTFRGAASKMGKLAIGKRPTVKDKDVYDVQKRAIDQFDSLREAADTEAAAAADGWIADNVEDGDTTELRAVLVAWFTEFDREPTMEELCEFACGE